MVTEKRNSSPRHCVKAGITKERASEEAIRLFKEGVGPLAIAVRLNVSARHVLSTLCGAGLIEGYEPQCWSLSRQFI